MLQIDFSPEYTRFGKRFAVRSLGGSSGEAIGYYDDGKLFFKYATVNGREHGVCRRWYPDGQMECEENYSNGARHGLSERWYENGRSRGKHLYVRGRLVTGFLNAIINSRELRAEDIIRIDNVEIRHGCLELLGYERFLSQLEHEIIDRSGEYELVRINWHKSEEPLYLVKVKCPSTGAFYTLRVPPSATTVKAAVAWTFGVKGEEYKPEVET